MRRRRKQGFRVKKVKGAFGKPKIFRDAKVIKLTEEKKKQSESQGIFSKLKNFLKRKDRRLV